MTPEEIGTAIRAYMRERCPACDGEKPSLFDPFCPKCFGRLSPDLQTRIVDRSQFIETYHGALAYLQQNTAPRSRKKGDKIDRQQTSVEKVGV
jgi:hypothetical protein